MVNLGFTLSGEELGPRIGGEAGFDHVYIHQVGPEQEECNRFYQREISRRSSALQLDPVVGTSTQFFDLLK